MSNTILKSRFFAKVDLSGPLIELFDLIPSVSFFVKDRKGRFMALNRRGQKYCGVATEQDALGKTDFDFFPETQARIYHNDDVAVMESEQAIINRIESAPEAAGLSRLVMTTKIPVRDKRGRVIGIAGFSRQVEKVRDSRGTVADFAEVIRMMNESYDRRLRTEELAASAGLSVSQFERRFKKAFGTSVRQYLLRIRIENAEKRLTETNLSIARIALDCGFYDHAHFSRAFRRFAGVSPSEYRRGSR